MEKELLYIYNEIIDKYELSSKFKNDSKGNIYLKLGECKLYSESLNRFKINDELINLKRQGNLEIFWYDRNNIIDKIKVNSNNIDCFYELTGRNRKKDLIDEYIIKVSVMLQEFQTEWIRQYLKDILKKLNQRKIPKDMAKIDYIFKTLVGLEDMSQNSLDDMLIRVFSKKYLKNSKVFADEVKGTIISILKNYYPLVDKEMEEDTVLEQVGIIKTSNDLYLKGDLKFELEGEIIDVSKFKYGIGLNKDMMKNIKIHAVGEIKELISIENKANFLSELYDKNKIIVFSHGYFAPYERKFLLMLKDFLPTETEYYHSGDLDLGGFNIYKHIKKHIFLNLKPINMNKEIYFKFLDYGESASDSYLKKLDNINLEEFKELIEIMKEKKLVIEQESFLVEVR